MHSHFQFLTVLVAIALVAPAGVGCSSEPPSEVRQKANQVPEPPSKTLVADLPTVGIIIYPKVLGTEVFAPADVFAKHSEDGAQLFNVVTIAQTADLVDTEEGLRIAPDFLLSNAPALDVLVVPSAYDMDAVVGNEAFVQFIREQFERTDYTVSNCAGANLIGAAGIADGMKIVTWIGGGDDLKLRYPNLDVQDDGETTYVEDGKLLSSNGNLASYVSSLELLEKMTSQEHRAYIEDYLYLERLKTWE